MKNSNKLFTLVLMASLISSCGNPHLIQEESIQSDSVIQKQDPLVVENTNKEAEKNVNVENNLGGKDLNFGQLPKDQEITKDIIVTSISEDSIPVSARFEKGEHFFFNGGKFPGTNGNCSQLLKAKESCKLDIGFDASSVGKFEDTLIITTKNGSEFKIPVYGERVEVLNKANNSHLTLGNLKAQILDFGTINAGDKSTKILEIQNNFDQTIPVKSIHINNELFKISDKSQCQKEVKSGSCFIEISFEPNKSIEIESVLTITEETGHKLEVLVKGKAITQTNEEIQIQRDAEREAEKKKLEEQIAESQRQKKALEDEARLAQERSDQAKRAEQEAQDKLRKAEEELAKKKAEIEAERKLNEQKDKEKAELARLAEINAEKQKQLEAALKEAEELKKARDEAARKLEEAERMAREALERDEQEAKKQAELLADKKRKEQEREKERADAEANYKQCIAKNEISLSLAPKTRTILASAVLPYLLSSKQTKQKLGLLYNNESNAIVKNADIKIVNDAQVVSTFLTADKINAEVDDILLTLDLTKVETDKYNETEMLCLSSQSVKKCSGRLFSLADWLALKNPEFFKLHKMPVTRTYENILSQNVIKCGDLDCERMEKTLSLKEILKLSDREMELLKKDKIIHIILTDDTRQTSSPKMIFKTKEAKECSRKLETLNRKD